MQKHVVIVGAGIGGLATACLLSKDGYKVSLFEKNEGPGGRAGQLKAKGFTFDTGPSWYLMPDVYEHFFSLLGEDARQLLDLKRLDPNYRVFFKDTLLGAVDIAADAQKAGDTFEALEPGGRSKLRAYLQKSAQNHRLVMDNFIYTENPRSSLLSTKMLTRNARLNLLSNMQKYVSRYFDSRELQKIMLYPVVFLGTNPKSTPALFNIINHVDFNQGVFYPKDGMYGVTRALTSLAEGYGTSIHYKKSVQEIIVEKGHASGVRINDEVVSADLVISNADLHHTEQVLLASKYRSYSKRFWRRCDIAPSALLMYLGVKGTYPNLRHHNLVFSKNWDANFKSIFHSKKWPNDPSFYVCNPSKTDPKLGPKNHENLFVVVPLPATTHYSSQELDKYADFVLAIMEKTMHLEGLSRNLVYKKLFGARDFETQFHAFHGSALGLSHTSKQTLFRPQNISKKVGNLYYVGAGTHPGVGVPMCLVSAELVYNKLTGDQTFSPLQKL